MHVVNAVAQLLSTAAKSVEPFDAPKVPPLTYLHT